MLMNNLDPEVAEKPQELTVYGGIGRAARNWESFDAIVATLKRLKGDETLLIQSGNGSGSSVPMRTRHGSAGELEPGGQLGELGAFQRTRSPGVDDVRPDDGRLRIYIGSTGIVQGTHETFVEMGRQAYGGLKGRWILTAGLGGMGGAQTLAATFGGASMIAIECRPSSIEFRLKTRSNDVQAKSLDEALQIVERRRPKERRSRSAYSATRPRFCRRS